MRLRDRIKAAVQTFREAPDLHSRLTAAEHELQLADQSLERMGQECDQLRDTIQEKASQLTAAEDKAEDLSFRLYNTIEENDSRMQYLSARADALLDALREFPPRLSTTEDMKRFYDAVSYNLDPDGFTLYRTAQKLSGVDVPGLFPYEEACGVFEKATGHQLMSYLTACCFDAVEWNTIPGSMYERAELGEVDTTTPEYQRFERQLYESVLERMGFDEFLVPEELKQTAVPEQQSVPQESAMIMA
ncbi:MAG: hypothetical protein K2O18_08465 [Oscillospiraceae bacterium]|nr:hypothetical protein [Oscillospiraceae bacterium]